MTYMVVGTVIWLVSSCTTVGGCGSRFVSSVRGLSAGTYVRRIQWGVVSVGGVVLVLRSCSIGVVRMVGSGVVVEVGNDEVEG